MHPEFVGLLLAVNRTTIFRMGIPPFLQKKVPVPADVFLYGYRKFPTCVFLVISARTSILNTIININAIITLNTMINMNVPTWGRKP